MKKDPQAMTIAELQRALTPHLPKQAFARDPWRILYVFAAAAIVAGHTWLTAAWFAGEASGWLWVLSLFVACNAATFPYLYLHEAMHGAVFRSKVLSYLTSLPCGAFFGLSPYFWAAWHKAHHQHTACPRDPDRRVHPEWDRWESFLDVVEQRGKVYSWKRVPGLFMPMGLIPLSQAFFYLRVLTGESKFPCRKGLVALEYAAAAVIALLPAAFLDADVALFGVYVPFAAANWICGAYVLTNHSNQPLAHENRPLANSTSVHLLPGFRETHMGFGRHVEHHIFPGVTHGRLRAMQKALREHFPQDYREETFWRALGQLYFRNELPPVIEQEVEVRLKKGA